MPAPNQDARRPILVGLGEVLWDCFPDERRPGGAPANVAFHADQLGLCGVVCSRVGTDALGDELCDYLAQQGLGRDHIQRDPDHPTGTVDVHFDNGSPSYTINENVAWDYLTIDDTWRQTLADCAAVCFGTLAQRNEASRVTIEQCLEVASQAWRIYDVNLRPPFYDAPRIEASLHACRVAKLNREELPILADLLALGAGAPPQQAAAVRARYDVELVCMTRGKDGCVLFGDETVDLPGQRVSVADTVGAGDAFTAGLAAGLVWGWPLAAVARLANAVGGLVASRPGAMPNVRTQLAELVKTHAPS